MQGKPQNGHHFRGLPQVAKTETNEKREPSRRSTESRHSTGAGTPRHNKHTEDGPTSVLHGHAEHLPTIHLLRLRNKRQKRQQRRESSHKPQHDDYFREGNVG